MMLKYIPLDEGMMIMEEAIGKAKRIMQGYPETKFTCEEYQRCVYFMCTYHSSNEKSMQLYNQFKMSLEESINTMVLPSLMCQNDAYLLRQLVLMWSNYKLMARWLCRFFQYLDRFFIPQQKFLLSLDELSVSCFHDLVSGTCSFLVAAISSLVLAAVLSLINQEREGLQIDCDLLKNVLHIFVEIDKYGNTKYYEDFEQVMLVNTSAYYSQLASEWLLCDLTADYIQKVFWCLSQENRRASHYLHPGTAEKLQQVVRNQLLEQPANKLFEKKQAENCGMMTDYQINTLNRHYARVPLYFCPVGLFLADFWHRVFFQYTAEYGSFSQEILSKCAGMTLEGGSSVSTAEEWLAALMESSTNIC
ncbi:hypothetical protein JRO89_XS03G0317400 [Xanthoceras sorbifolium]|uniref:Cullin N-terminal domain-containing protein n=1 Tax=Xanthoceras sorbifolium TaxID=99658 RepID=A0ABQ8IDS9_9ROSI|nr:hypothetical protein JRO89_XS03G0317400 [Xanthoceras sorbifolium]